MHDYYSKIIENTEEIVNSLNKRIHVIIRSY